MQLAWLIAGALYVIKTTVNRIRLFPPWLNDSLRVAGPA